MSTTFAIAFQPRKTPVQSRSEATVDAILQATLQVLVSVGKEKLTTTLVAHRAGVSVGTLYQYFPNKSALLQATLRRHMDHVIAAVEDVCGSSRNRSIFDQATALIDTWLDAKLNDVNNSASLYAIASDVDGMRIARNIANRGHRQVTMLFSTATERLTCEPELLTIMVLSCITGVTRRLLEDKPTQKLLPTIREQLLNMVHAYLRTCIR
ncbi:TetR/AcrR family transcriptional regulator [Terriglobus sp. RCC_193]|uniref:TetR/AcrR family transcriptional regulator n=1 Tax=Terriglobus sp. RCC_193 TaxID=3239218 RepID=UPI0035244845